MAGPMIATKVYIPKLRRGVVPRPRLRDRLRRGADAVLTLVSAPAGFGKTTLLAEWIGEAGPDRSVAWLSLDSADNEPAVFWTYVLTALRTADPTVGSSGLELLASSPSAVDVALTAVVNDLAGVPHPVWLVLDDFHLVDSPQIGQELTFLLDHLPAQVHVVISTRSDPDLPLSRLRVRGELVEIRATDLRFTLDEAISYFTAVSGLDLTVDQIAVLEGRTEGWIAALQLAALSLQGRDDATGFIARFAGDDRYIVDYLVEEVLTHQPEAVRDFLLQSAILDRLTGPLCDAVTGRDDGALMLVALERANLFLVPLDDQRHWYRYHHLFADVLRARLLAGHPTLAPLLHQRASRWFEADDSAKDAIRHALAAPDFDRAAHLVELAVPSIRRHRQEAMMHGWLKLLPDSAVRGSPVLSVFYGSMLMVSGDLDAVEPRLDDAERGLASVPDGAAPPWADTEELRTLPATIAIYRASLAQARGDVAGTTQHARRALDLAGPSDHLARGGAAGFLGLAAWASGDLSSALETFTQAVASLHAAGNLVDELSSTVVLADMSVAVGRPSTARRLYQRALQLAEAHGEPVARATADLQVGLSEIDVEVGDLESAKRHLQTAAAHWERTPMSETRHRWFVAMGRVTQACGDPAEAVRLLDQAEQLYRPGFFPDVRPIAAMRARIWIADRSLSQAVDWARDRGVSPTDDVSYLSEFDHLTLVRLLIALHRAQPETGTLAQAVDLLARLADAAEIGGRAGSLVEIRLLQALAQHAKGHRLLAREALAMAWAETPEPAGYARLFLDEGAPMLELLGDPDLPGAAAAQARRLLTATATADAAVGATSPVVLEVSPLAAMPAAMLAEMPAGSPSDLSLSQRELQVLRLLASELSGPEMARELFISQNTLRTHTKHIFTKLDVTNRRAAVRSGRERGLI